MNDLVDLLLPHMGDPNDRRALVEAALYGCPVLRLIDWTGSARTFTARLVRTLLEYGECEPGQQAVVMLLEALKAQVGVNKHAEIDRLIAHYTSPAAAEVMPDHSTASQPRQLSPGDLIDKRYKLLQPIGDPSGQATVWRAEDVTQSIKLPVVVKCIKPHATRDYIGRFMEEIQAVRELEHHPNIIKIYDHGDDHSLLYIVMPVMKESLTARLKEGVPLPSEEALLYLSQVASGLDFAHKHGIVHRDLKPANFLFTPELDTLCLSDFGIAYRAERPGSVTGTNEIVGTEEYAAPEQLRCEDVTPQTDVYALAIIAYELLAGELPFKGAKAEMHAAHLTQEPPEHPNLSGPVLAALRQGAAKVAKDRPESASAFMVLLRDALSCSSPTVIGHYLSTTLHDHLREVMTEPVFNALVRIFVNRSAEVREQQVALADPEIELDLDLLDTEYLHVDRPGALDIELSGELHPPREAHYSDQVTYTANVRGDIRQLKHVVLLGEPGAGKTFMLGRLALDSAEAYHDDPTQRIPVFVPLSKYDSVEPFRTFVADRLGVIGACLSELNILWLLDGLNEMPREQQQWDHLEAFIGELVTSDTPFVLTCRMRNYDHELAEVPDLFRVDLQDLNPRQIHDILTHYLKPRAANHLWQTVFHGEGLLEAWDAWEGSVSDFWERPEDTWDRDDTKRKHLWVRARIHRDPRKLMLLGRNPFTLVRLLMPRLFTAWLECKGDLEALAEVLNEQLPNNRAELFGQVIGDMLKAEAARQHWSDEEVAQVRDALGFSAAELQGQEQRTDLPLADLLAAEQTPEGLLDRLQMGRDAGLVSLTETSLRFNHQLFQEYFATQRLRDLLDDYTRRFPGWEEGDPLPPRDEQLATQFPRWWNAGGWRVTVSLLGELERREGISRVVRWLASYGPEIALNGVLDNNDGVTVEELTDAARQALIEGARLHVDEPDPVGRAAAYRILGRFDADKRQGIGTRLIVAADGREVRVPDIDWVPIPGGRFQYGHKSESDNPPRVLNLPAFEIARYPITYAQFRCFVDDPEGFSSNRWWVGMPEEAKGIIGATYRLRDLDEQYFKFWNHPRETVSWYQAMAFCRWLSAKLGCEITLPTEQQWERAARGTDGREYSYEGEFDPAKGNTSETRIGQTSAVGIFPQGASPEGLLDMSGNVWQWCLNKYEDPEDMGVDESNARRVVRGGSWNLDQDYARAVYRSNSLPDSRNNDIGFRVCRPPSR